MNVNFKQLAATLTILAPVMMTQALTLKSADVTNGHSFKSAQVFNQWGCTGGNISPQLVWSDKPAGTKSFAITMYDPNAPTGSGWWHWVVINIPLETTSLKKNAGIIGGKNLPKGATMIANDYGFRGFGGACPPPRDGLHNYTITVYALDIDRIEIPANATAALAGYNIQAHIIEKAEIIAPSNSRK